MRPYFRLQGRRLVEARRTAVTSGESSQVGFVLLFEKARLPKSEGTLMPEIPSGERIRQRALNSNKNGGLSLGGLDRR